MHDAKITLLFLHEGSKYCAFSKVLNTISQLIYTHIFDSACNENRLLPNILLI